MRLVIVFSFFTIVTSKYLLVHIKDDGERTAGIVDSSNTEAAWCHDIDCGTKVAMKMCPTTCQVGDEGIEPKCGISHASGTRIIGGTEITPHSEPWLVPLCYDKRSCGGCDGTLISQKHVLTAAHCDQSMYLGAISNFKYVLVGAHQINKLDKGLVEIQKWVTHEDAKQLSGKMPQGEWLKELGGADNDISILVLSKKVEFNNNVQPACLPSSLRQNSFKDSVFVSGWGSTKLKDTDEGIKGTTASIVPKRAQMELITKNECDRKINRMNCAHCDKESMLCAYGIKDFNSTVREDSCTGDSGGPLVQHDSVENKAIVIGVVSFGYGCGQIDYPAIYTRVSTFVPWIKKVMAEY